MKIHAKTPISIQNIVAFISVLVLIVCMINLTYAAREKTIYRQANFQF